MSWVASFVSFVEVTFAYISLKEVCVVRGLEEIFHWHDGNSRQQQKIVKKVLNSQANLYCYNTHYFDKHDARNSTIWLLVVHII